MFIAQLSKVFYRETLIVSVAISHSNLRDDIDKDKQHLLKLIY